MSIYDDMAALDASVLPPGWQANRLYQELPASGASSGRAPTQVNPCFGSEGVQRFFADVMPCSAARVPSTEYMAWFYSFRAVYTALWAAGAWPSSVSVDQAFACFCARRNILPPDPRRGSLFVLRPVPR